MIEFSCKTQKEEQIMSKKASSHEMYKNIKVVETTPEDGFVSESKIRPIDSHNQGKIHKGYAKRVVVITNDPKKTRAVAYSMAMLWVGIGLFVIILTRFIFGSMFLFSGITIFFKAKKDIDEIESGIKNNRD